MIKSLFKSGVTSAAGWLGGKIAGPTGSAIASKAVGGLFSKDGGSGGDFKLQTQNPNAYEQNFGGRLGFERSDSAGNVNKIKTADGKQLSEEWEYRLNKWYKNKDTRYT